MAEIPMFNNLYIGRGLNSSTGKGFGTAIEFDEPESIFSGQKSVLELVSISSSRELVEKLSISASASFSRGIGGASAEFSLTQSREFNSYYTYALVKIIVLNPPVLLRNPRLKSEAQKLLLERGWDEFSEAYGWEYVEGYITGGSYYGLIEIQTTNSKEQREVKGKLSGFYGSLKASAGLESTFKEINKNTTTNVFLSQSGGSGDILEISLEDMIKQANEFPKLIKQNPVPITAITTDYQSTVPIPQIPSPDSLPRIQQKNTLEELGREYLNLRDYKADLQFVLDRLTEFDEHRDLELEELESKRKEYRNSLQLVADEIDRVTQLASTCANDFNQCQTYVKSKSVQFLPLPKIGGDLMTIKQIEQELSKLRSEINSKINENGYHVGTVIASLLPADRFFSITSWSRNEWVEADGRPVPNSKYISATGRSNVPNLNRDLNGLEVFKLVSSHLSNGEKVPVDTDYSWEFFVSLRDISGYRFNNDYEQDTDNFQVFLDGNTVTARGRTLNWKHGKWGSWKSGLANYFGIGYRQKPKVFYYIKIN